jgi:hypothetical protein
VPHPRERVEALRKGRLASDRGRVTLAMAILGPHYSVWDVVVQDLALAREFGLLSTSHATRRKQDCVTPDGYLRLAKEGLIGPEHNIVHANFFEDDELKAVVEAGASVTPTVMVELHSDYADPLTPRLRALGALPSIGNDVEPIVSGDMFREMQAALLHPAPPAAAGLADLPEPALEFRTARADFEASVRAGQEAIRDGEVFQVVLSQRFDLDCPADALDVYRVLRATNPSPYMYLYRTEDARGRPLAVVGSIGSWVDGFGGMGGAVG